MPRNPDLPCAKCGKLMWRRKNISLPAGEAMCHPCRRLENSAVRSGKHGTLNMYDRGKCRCDLCRAVKVAQVSEWRHRTGYRSRKTVKHRTCAHCGAPFTTKRAARFCSISCGKIGHPAWNKRSTELAVYTGPPFTRQPKINTNPIRQSKRVFKSVRCTICQSWFVTLFTDVTCSAECQQIHAAAAKQSAQARRRARKRDAYVADVWRIKVYEADGYRCHLCRRKCKRKFTYLADNKTPHPRSPTIDHLIPLAKGGPHEPANCRLACWECNTHKSDRGSGDQFALVI